jgi:serine/threonine protein kinase
VSDRRREEIMGQQSFHGADGLQSFFNLKVIFEPNRTGFEESKDFQHPKGSIIGGRYEVSDVLGSAAFSTALQCVDLAAEDDEDEWVCLKVIKNNKDFFDQSLDEIKLLQFINSRGDPDENHVLRVIDFFYYKEHLFIVSELLKENLYEFGRFVKETDNDDYYTIPRLKKIMKQMMEALSFIHSLNLIHCDIKPENIVIKSFSRCEVKLIDFGSSCFTTDHLTTYIQSRSYRAPEVIIGHRYDSRIDIWSIGAVLAELYTGYVLFQNDSVATMLSRITGIMGPFPPHVIHAGKDSGKYFTLSNIVYERTEDKRGFNLVMPKKTNLRSRLHLYDTKSSPQKERRSALDDDLFVDFVEQLLNLDPIERLTAQEALRHPWLDDADSVHIEPYVIIQPGDGDEGDGDDDLPVV